MTTPTQKLARSIAEGVIREDAWLRRKDRARLGPFVLQALYMAWAPWEGLRGMLTPLDPPHEPLLTPEQKEKLGAVLDKARARAADAAAQARTGA